MDKEAIGDRLRCLRDNLEDMKEYLHRAEKEAKWLGDALTELGEILDEDTDDA